MRKNALTDDLKPIVVENVLRCVRMTAGAVKFIYRYFVCFVTSETLHIDFLNNKAL